MKMLQRIIGLTVVLLLPSATPAGTATIFSSRDTTIYQANPNNSNGAGPYMYVGTNANSTASRGLIRFDIAGKIPAGSTITNVQLTLLQDPLLPPGDFVNRKIQLRRLLADWGEGTTGQGSSIGAAGSLGFPTPADGTAATWSNRFYNTVFWNNPGGDFADTASASATVGFLPSPDMWGPTSTMTSDVQSWLDNPSSNYGWLLLGDESAPGTVRRFFTREGQSINPASMPSLVVTYSAAAGAPSRVLVSTNPVSVRAGDAFDVTVIVTDKNGNVATGYTGTLTFSSTDPFPGLVPGDYTFTSIDQGTHTFPGGATFFTAGLQTLTAKDTTNSALNGSALVQVNPLPADQLQLTVPQTPVVSGTPFDVTVTALDPYLNVDTNYAGTVAWLSSDVAQGVVLPGPYMFQPTDAGVHTFAGGVTLTTFGDQLLYVYDTVSGINALTFVFVGF